MIFPPCHSELHFVDKNYGNVKEKGFFTFLFLLLLNENNFPLAISAVANTFSRYILLRLFTGEGFDGRALFFLRWLAPSAFSCHLLFINLPLYVPSSVLVIQTREVQNSSQHNTTLLKQTEFDFCLEMGPGASLGVGLSKPHPHNGTRDFTRTTTVWELRWPSPPFMMYPDRELENNHGTTFPGCYITTPCGITLLSIHHAHNTLVALS